MNCMKKLVCCAVLTVAFHATTARSLPDRDAPKVSDLIYGPAVVSTGSVFTVSLTASDPLGVESITFFASPNQGYFYPCSSQSTPFTLMNGTNFDGTWKVECFIEEGTPSQMYAFNYNCIDTAGHSAYELIRNGFEVSGGPAADYTAPEIKSIEVKGDSGTDPVVTAGTQVNVYLTITDVSGSGVDLDASYVKIHQSVGNMVPCSSDGFMLNSGSVTDGVFLASCTVPRDTPNGEYWLEVHVYDAQFNWAEQTVDDAFEVVGGAVPDHTPPKITQLTYTPAGGIQRGSPDGPLYVTAVVSDTESGVDYVNFEARESYTQALLCSGAMDLQQGGNSSAGTWAFSCVVPADAEVDFYTGSVFAFDKQNNEAMSSSGFQVLA